MFNTVASPGAIAKVSSPRGSTEMSPREEFTENVPMTNEYQSMITADNMGGGTLSDNDENMNQ
jgi:hypothetical protein|tara:strand:- start:1539 stop:1727 length:189 start_codon:yes stop_codon:yes gene_type:complete